MTDLETIIRRIVQEELTEFMSVRVSLRAAQGANPHDTEVSLTNLLMEDAACTNERLPYRRELFGNVVRRAMALGRRGGD